MLRIGLFLSLACLGPYLHAQTASLDAPASVTIGAEIEVNWTGPGDNYDSIYVIVPSADDSASGIYSTTILNQRNPVTVRMPETPGNYELRYWSRAGKSVLARRAIATEDVPTSLSAPDIVQVGAEIEVQWQGPGNRYDPIILVPAGAPEGAPEVARAAVLGERPVRLHLPEEPGDYELRYLTRDSRRVLAVRPIRVNDIAASLEVAAQVDIGARIEVAWTGPGNQYDRIELHAAGAAPDARAAASASIISSRNPVYMKAPETPGQYELRYTLRQSGRVLARHPLTVGAVEASLEAPPWATASTLLLVDWQGPGNDYDQVGVFAPNAPDDAKALASASILSRRNPLPLKLPDVEGDYQLRYRLATSGRVLARRPISIAPAGRLRVVFEREGDIGGSSGLAGAVELILDASGSMLQRDRDGRRRIEIARQVLDDVVREYLRAGQPFALRVFGHREPGKCRGDLEIPLGPLDPALAATTIAGVNAMNLAKTPIADSLAQVPSDLAGASGPGIVVLITDGEETCGGDPAAVIAGLRSGGLDVQLFIVGFAIDDPELKQAFASWAQLGGGSYFDASSAQELRDSLRTVISGPFRVVDANGEIAGQGVIGGAAVVLPAGTYRVETVAPSPRVLEGVVVAPGEQTEAAF